MFIVNMSLALGNAVLGLVRKTIYRKPKAPGKILIFRTGSIGDSLCAFPAIYAIRKKYPDAKLDILTASGADNLVSIDKMLDPSQYDDVIDYLHLSVSQWSKVVRDKKYDLIIQLPQSKAPLKSLLRDMVFFRFVTKIPSGIGWNWAFFPYFRQAQEKAGPKLNERDRLLEILEKDGIENQQEEVRINIPDREREKALALLPSFESGKPLVAIVPGAKRPQNRWPIAYFKQLAEKMVADFNLVVIGGPDEKELGDELLISEQVINLAGKCTPIQSAAIMQQCVFTISNDTGPMHMSYFSGTPVIALFSSRDFPGLWFPPDDGLNQVFRNGNVHCSLCLSETCGDNICMQGIQVAEVYEAAIQLNKKIHV